jgi:uncharacterized protein with NRDE domain
VCLLGVAVAAHPRFPLVIAANRDEFYARPTARAGWWDDAPGVLAGRDLEHGGTWLGVTRTGRLAALTNFRDPSAVKRAAPSRGLLVSGYLTGAQSARDYLGRVARSAAEYNDFNLLVGTPDEILCLESRTGEIRALDQGVHGLSNALLDTPWPKVVRLRQALADRIATVDGELDPDRLLPLLTDPAMARDEDLPRTGVAQDLERSLSAAFIRLPRYGTRCSTIVCVDAHGRLGFVERAYGPSGAMPPDVRVSFDLEPATHAGP